MSRIRRDFIRRQRRRVCTLFLTSILLGLIGNSVLAQAEAQEVPTPSARILRSATEDVTLADEEAQLLADKTKREEQHLVTETARTDNTDLPPAPDQLALPEAEYIHSLGHEASATPRRLRYMLGLTLRTVYDDNINISKLDRQSDFYTTIEPTINVGFGDIDNNFLALTYSPNAYLFATHSENDAIQHSISLNWQYRLPRVTVNLSEDIQILDGTGLNSATGTGTDFTRTNLDVAGRTQLNIYSTRLDVNYSLTGKTFLTGGINYNLSDYASLISSSVLSGNVYLNYTYSPKLSIGAGVTGGYDAVDAPSNDQTFEQLNIRASYELTGKVSASVSAGFEFRQVGNGASDNGSPIFDGTVLYQPFDGTSLAMTLSRRTQNSATLAAQDFHSTSVILSGRQRFLRRLFLGLSLGYENSSYFSTATGIDSNRSDDYFFVQPSLDVDITSFWTAGIYYFYRESDSSLAAFSFYDNQIGFRTSFTF
ncbi:MAG: outer membrane beta-barrel protein [Chthoniobacterales bacterium]|nr:outer membrane beta-barrel protein [Chthoniobacterales bacterium]